MQRANRRRQTSDADKVVAFILTFLCRNFVPPSDVICLTCNAFLGADNFLVLATIIPTDQNDSMVFLKGITHTPNGLIWCLTFI